MPTPPLPAHVVTNELIESSWGNSVVTLLEATDLVMGGATPGATVAPGNQTQTAYIDLPAGVWLVFYAVLATSSNDIDLTIRSFVGGGFQMDTRTMAKVQGSSAAQTAHAVAYADFSGGASQVTFNFINNGAGNVSCYADSTNHRLWAMQGRKP